MEAVAATFAIPDWIAAGLSNGVYERAGGVIREAGSKQVIAWLKEVALPNLSSSTIPSIDPVTGALNLAISSANLGVSVKGFSEVKQQLGVVQQNLQQVQGSLQITSASSLLNLGFSVIGFAVVMHRLKGLEKRLQKAQEVLNKVNYKIDLSFYANFRAALDLATNAFSMSQPAASKSMAVQAINRFLEAEHIYVDYADKELERASQIADEYLLTLALAYISEARCYLELEETDAALRRLQDGSNVLRPRIRKYVKLLLTSNPAIYLHPRFKDKVDLARLTKVFQWLEPNLDEKAVFELQRENLFKLALEQDKWIETLPAAILDRAEVKEGWFGPDLDDLRRKAVRQLPKAMEVMESMIETNDRFEAYQEEVKAIKELGISFHDWMKLAPDQEAQPEGTNLMYIIPASSNDRSTSIGSLDSN
ncbi:hypothetical protein [Leptolyngbya sp. FACHB-261]|uniref:hypothetical protein n=1 Tax=Leptolyngbya sp. FACHB-261 TaxID=2692806 RepID=UPI0016841479|nr:hypothetical protein [Leptolyngbya sp. FACHB-261]MBD2101777.1 hypothetical protein [Leptolyngbya sp. FACHB-261]